MANNVFPENAPSAPIVFYRTYSRYTDDGKRETFQEMVDRVNDAPNGIADLGMLTPEQASLVKEQHSQLKMLPAGRMQWVSGTRWLDNPANSYGVFNCNNTSIDSWEDVSKIVELLMMGCGVGYVLGENIKNLPTIKRSFNVEILGEFGTIIPGQEHTEDYFVNPDRIVLTVGDSRQGWADAVRLILEYLSDTESQLNDHFTLVLNVRHIRKPNEKIKGFGGSSNPNDFPKFFQDLSTYFKPYKGRELDDIAVCWLVCRVGLFVVAGNVRRSAEIAQFKRDSEGAFAKAGLWEVDESGSWYMPNPLNSALTMANFTRVFDNNPTYEECLDAATKQYYSGEGAIQSAPNTIARVLGLHNKALFNKIYTEDGAEVAKEYVRAYCENNEAFPHYSEEWLEHCFESVGLNPCGK